MTTGKFSGLDTTTWRGIRTCQCSLCFELFSGESTFALHRVGQARVQGRPGKYKLGHCRDPKSKGLALNEFGVWTLPTDPDSSLARLNG